MTTRIFTAREAKRMVEGRKDFRRKGNWCKPVGHDVVIALHSAQAILGARKPGVLPTVELLLRRRICCALDLIRLLRLDIALQVLGFLFHQIGLGENAND